MPESDAEIVIHTERAGVEMDLLVDSVEDAAARFVDAGGTVDRAAVRHRDRPMCSWCAIRGGTSW